MSTPCELSYNVERKFKKKKKKLKKFLKEGPIYLKMNNVEFIILGRSSVLIVETAGLLQSSLTVTDFQVNYSL